MKTKLLMIIGLIGFISLSAHANGFDRKSAELGVKAGIYIERNKSNILSWSRLLACRYASTWPPVRINTWPLEC